ncbi:hypothetical protein L6R52_26855 [Myxococcota bacterium]|nr:hypothetical protein [Myxococcota bacterium]
MITLAFALATTLASQPSGAASQPAQPSSQPVVQGEPGTARDVAAAVTIIFEVNERVLSVQEDWTIGNPANRAIPLDQLEIPTPRKSKFLRVEPTTKGYTARETSVGLQATEPLTGQRTVQAGYILDLSGGSIDVNRPIPFSMQTVRIVIQDSPGLEVKTSVPSEKRTRDLSGVTYAVYDIASVPAGATLTISLDGLPSRTIWPARAALASVFAILAWMVWALVTKRAPGGGATSDVVSPMAARARRDQIVKAIEVLERDFAAEKIKEKKYERRRSELMKELAVVLREIELAKEAAAGPSAMPPRSASADA